MDVPDTLQLKGEKMALMNPERGAKTVKVLELNSPRAIFYLDFSPLVK